MRGSSITVFRILRTESSVLFASEMVTEIRRWISRPVLITVTKIAQQRTVNASAAAETEMQSTILLNIKMTSTY